MAAKKSSPTGRALRMAAMGAGVAGSYVGYLMQSAFLGKDKRATKLKSAHSAAGRRMRDEMMSLRGPAMKLGQALSLQSGILPDETLAELSALQMEAPGMHPSLVRAQFRGSVGRNPEDVYRDFEETPFAAASLGQVHRATLPNGEPVAVKIQYPGIRDAIANDFKWFRTVSTPARASGHMPANVVDELETQIIAETDYVREADNIGQFSQALRPLSFVSVPRAHRKYSTDKVLTMSFVEGEHLERFLARRPSQKLRDLVGARLFELHYFQLLRMGAFHADPHWGNYLFTADGSIGLVDFGCVKHLEPEFVAHLRRVYLFPGDRDSSLFRDLLAERYALLGAKPAPAAMRALQQFSKNFYGRVYPPDAARENDPFDFADASVLRDYMRESQQIVRSKGMLPDYVLLARAETGLYQTLHRLRARVHTSKTVRRYLNESDQPSSTRA